MSNYILILTVLRKGSSELTQTFSSKLQLSEGSLVLSFAHLAFPLDTKDLACLTQTNYSLGLVLNIYQIQQRLDIKYVIQIDLLIIIIITSMASSYAFAFPKSRPNSFKLLTGSTVGYIADSIFYRLDLHSGKAQALHHPEGRTYQAFTALQKRGMTVLADYGKSSNLYFYFQQSSRNFSIRGICPLEILAIELSLDGKYLAVACGSPTFKVFIVNVEERQIISGSQNYIDLKQHSDKLIKLEFNPSNRRFLSILFKDRVQVYELKDCFELTQRGSQKGIIIIPKHSMSANKYQASIWDELGNIYLAAQNRLWVWSTETGAELASYDIQIETSEDDIVRALQLTPKHIIVFYSNGRTQWLFKFYPELLDEDSTIKPFQCDKYHQSNKRAVHAIYDHHFTKLLLAYDDGFMGVLEIPAEDNKADEDEDEQDRKKKAREIKKLDVQGSIIGPYHRKGIILIKEIQNTSLVITVSLGGRVILWSGKQRRQLGYFDAEGDITSADINSKANVLAIGTSDGLIQFYSISSFQNPFLFKEIRLTKGNHIHQITFSSTSQQLAVLCKDEDRVYYILTNIAMPFEVLGYVTLPHRPLYISWNRTQKVATKPKHQMLLVSVGYGVLSINGPAAVPAKRRGEQLNLVTQIYAIRTDLDQNFVCALASGQILTTGDDKFIKKYRQPQQLLAKVDFKAKQPIPPPLEEIDAHDLKITCWECGPKWLVSGGADGTVQLRQTNNLSAAKSYKVAGWKQQNLSAVSYSQKGGIYTGSFDGCFQVWRVQGGQVSGDEHKIEQISFKKLTKERTTKYFEIMIEEEYLERMKEVITGKKKIQLQKLSKIKSELNALLAQNQSHEELERLNRDQFAIDLESREEVAKKGREKCLQIRDESRLKILKNEVLAKKLKQITWDRMDVHLKAINGLKNSFVVFNYQLRKIGKEDKRRLQIIFDLRRAQRKQLKKRTPQLNYEFYNNKNVVNGGVVQPLIMATVQKQEKKDEKVKKKKQQEQVANQADLVQQIFNEDQWSLLYNAFELFSDNAKRNQIVMMKHMILRVKETFNKEFEKILKLRQNQNQIINDKNKRIEEICEELKKSNQSIRGRKNILQSNDSILQVKPNQIPFKRYLSKEQREKAEKERLKQEERLRKLAEDDASLRALQKMMGGTLEQKKTSVLQVTMQKEKWMEKPLDQMSEQEKAKLKQFQQKKQKAEQQKQRIVKKLQAQLRKLKQEIDDIMEKYDQKLFALIKRRLEYDYRIEEQQLYCTRLFLSMGVVQEQQFKRVQLQKRIEDSKIQLQKIADQKQSLIDQQAQYEKAKESKHAGLDSKKLGDIESKIKTIEKSIFQEYSTNIKKRRELQQKLIQSDPHYKNLLVPLDPMKEIQSKNLAVEKAKDFSFFIAQIKVLQQTYDIPQSSLMQILQSRFNIRKEQAQIDHRIKVLKQTLGIFEERWTSSQENLRNQQAELNSINDYLVKAESDLEVQCRIKQGQVELNNEKPVPQLSEALLIAKGEIQEKNVKIRANADEKIKVMEQIKTCKISVTQQTLNLEKKEELIEKLNSMIKEIQMLKVKKEMQVALAKKDTKINENEVKSLKQQIQKVRKEGEKRIQLFEKKIEKIGGQIETIKKENKALDTQKWNLEVTVKQREKIKEMMVGQNGEGDQQAKEKFEQIAINRKLFDRAKQQTEQIELLREELSKLKAKTFANFSNAQR